MIIISDKVIKLDLFAKRLTSLISDSSETTYSLARKLGLTPATISRYANGLMKPKVTTLKLMAQIFDVNDEWLMGYDVERTSHEYNKSYIVPEISTANIEFPIIGDIAAGFDKIAIEEWTEDKISIPKEYLKEHSQDEFFVLRVTGDSMYPDYRNGDKLLIFKQQAVDFSGQVAAVIYGNDYGTLKKVEYRKDSIHLVPINPQYTSEIINGADMDCVHILGVPKLLIRDIDD